MTEEEQIEMTYVLHLVKTSKTLEQALERNSAPALVPIIISVYQSIDDTSQGLLESLFKDASDAYDAGLYSRESIEQAMTRLAAECDDVLKLKYEALKMFYKGADIFSINKFLFVELTRLGKSETPPV